MNTLNEYNEAAKTRTIAIRRNISRRARGMEPLPLPPKPEKPKVRIAYSKSGDYIGRLAAGEACPDGCIIKMEPARW